MPRALSLVISLSVGIIVWVLSERLFPAAFPTATEGQKIFWGLGIIFAATIVAESVQLLYRIEQRIKETSLYFQKISDADVEKHFKDIYEWYYGDFREIRRWVKKAIGTFHEEMGSGYIYMLPQPARADMAQMYRTAKKWVVTTNVVNLDFFLGDPDYQDLNRQTFQRGVPVIRFFLCDSPPNAQFRHRVVDSMTKLNTVCVALINLREAPPIVINGLPPGPRDFLLVDRWFVADAELNPGSWEIMRIRATIRPDNIQMYCQYLHQLRGIHPELIGLDDIGVSEKAALDRRFPEKKGREIFNQIMMQV